MLAGAVLGAQCTRERRSLVLELVERRLHRDVQLRCRLHPLERDNADVRARHVSSGCRGGIVERKRANVRPCDVHDAEQRIDERQRAGVDRSEQARLRCDVHVQQRLLPLVVEPSHMRTGGYNG